MERHAGRRKELSLEFMGKEDQYRYRYRYRDGNRKLKTADAAWRSTEETSKRGEKEKREGCSKIELVIWGIWDETKL